MKPAETASVCPLCGIPEAYCADVGCHRMRCRTFAAKALVGLGVSIRQFLRRCDWCDEVREMHLIARARLLNGDKLGHAAVDRLADMALDGAKYLGRPWVST